MFTHSKNKTKMSRLQIEVQTRLSELIPNLDIDTLEYCYHSAYTKKVNVDKEPRATKAWFSGFTYLFYSDIKEVIRTYNLNSIIEQAKAGQLSLKSAVHEILTMVIGETDLDSFKYLFLQGLIGVNAKSQEEAEEIVQYSIDYLSTPIAHQKLIRLNSFS